MPLTDFTLEELATLALGPAAKDYQYADLVWAENYFATRLHCTAWYALNVTDRSKALIMATRAMDRIQYKDEKTSSAQSLEFPRGGNTETPDDIKIACCEEALSIADGVEPDKELAQAQLVSQGFAGVRATYDPSAVPEHLLAGIGSATAWRYIRPYVKEAGAFRISRAS